MTTIILSIGVANCKGKVKAERLAVVSLGKRKVLLPVVFPKGRNLEAKRREAHRLIDDCVDAYKKQEGEK